MIKTYKNIIKISLPKKLTFKNNKNYREYIFDQKKIFDDMKRQRDVQYKELRQQKINAKQDDIDYMKSLMDKAKYD